MRACRGFSGVLQLNVDSAGIAPADYDFKDFVKPLPTTLLQGLLCVYVLSYRNRGFRFVLGFRSGTCGTVGYSRLRSFLLCLIPGCVCCCQSSCQVSRD